MFGINGVKGILEYPELRKTSEVVLTDVDRENITLIRQDICNIIELDLCPPIVKKGLCKNSSYFAFCYSNEMEEDL